VSRTTRYSEKISGTERNWVGDVRFDHTDGYLGITQFNESLDRVLLSPHQVKGLLEFLNVRGKLKRT